MIQVTISRKGEHRSIVAYKVSGHSGYDDSGRDIVCAGVSAIAIGTFNALEALLQVTASHRMDEGLLEVAIPISGDGPLQEKIQLLLESMVVILSSIADEYRSHVRITEQVSS